MATIDTAGTAWSTGIEETGNNGRSDGKHVPHDSAQSLGVVPEGETFIVKELREDVKLLTERVTADSQRFVDYENDIRVLQAQLRQEKRRNEVNTPTIEQNAIPPIARPQPPSISRFGSFIGSRKPVAPISPDREREFEAALLRETTQRLAAEKKIAEMNGEIEELSATLFQQANEMVSTERKENAALKERIRVLEERDTKFSSRLEGLEHREKERKRRMDKLDSAIKRIERAKALLVPR